MNESLLDECVTKKLKPFLRDFDIWTVTEMGWSGVKNGKLMSLCVENGFDVLLTVDKNLMYQQNLNKYKVSILVINCITSKIDELRHFVPDIIKRLKEVDYHKVYVINKPE